MSEPPTATDNSEQNQKRRRLSKCGTIDEEDRKIVRSWPDCKFEVDEETDFRVCSLSFSEGQGYGASKYHDYLPEEVSMLSGLQKLSIYGGFLKSLPSSIGSLQMLKTLHIRRTALRHFPKEIGLLPNLQQLRIWEHSILSIPKEIGNLENLTSLDLNENDITSLPKGIGLLRNLQRLDLSRNELQDLPEEIGNLVNLSDLILNKVHQYRSRNLASMLIPPSIERLQNLTSLSLVMKGNPPKEIGNLSRLEKLDLAIVRIDNSEIQLPSSMGNLQKLKYLTLRMMNERNPEYYPEYEDGFDARQLDFIRMLPKLQNLVCVVSPKPVKLIMEIVKATPSLESVKYGKKVIGCSRSYYFSPIPIQMYYILASRRFQQRSKRLPKVLHLLLTSRDVDHDDMYMLLVSGRGYFVQILMDRKSNN